MVVGLCVCVCVTLVNFELGKATLVCYYICTHTVMVRCTRFTLHCFESHVIIVMLVVVAEYTNINSCMTVRHITNNHNKWVGKSCTKLFAQVYLK